MSVRGAVDRDWRDIASPVLFVTVAVLLELTLFTTWRPFGLAPDPLLVVVVCLAFFKGPEWGAIAGLAGGFGLDLAMGELVGLTALSKMCMGLGFGWMARFIFSNHVVVQLCAVPIATFLDQFVYVLALKSFGYPMPPVSIYFSWVSMLAVMNLVVGIPFYVYAFRRWRSGRGGGGWSETGTTSIG